MDSLTKTIIDKIANPTMAACIGLGVVVGLGALLDAPSGHVYLAMVYMIGRFSGYR